MRARYGFSLAEVAMGVSIAIAMSSVVAVASNYTMKKAKETEFREVVKDYVQATEQYMTRMSQTAGADQVPQSHAGIAIFEQFRANPRIGGGYEGRFTNLYTQDSWAVPFYHNTSADADGAIATNFAQANYPKAIPLYKGAILYVYRWPRTKTSFQVWDGAQYKRFQYYAYQGIDESGYPVVTMGR